MSIVDIAISLNVTRQQLHRISSEKSGISPEMALRLGKFCGNGEQVWLRMQASFDVWHARQKLGKQIEAIPTVEMAASA